MTAIEITCEDCLAGPWEMCKNPDGTPAERTHFVRLSQAEYITTPSTNDPEVVKEAIDAAVDDLV